jgi:putative protein-disulfide isomerase
MNHMLHLPRITYVFDPFCGWCYGASSLVDALAREGYRLTLKHRALFTGSNAHPHCGPFPAHARRFDADIARRSGALFSQAYFDNVLGDTTQILHSFTSALAKQAVERLEPAQVLPFVRAVQKARFQDGLDATDPKVLKDCAGALGLPAADVLALMFDDPSIWQAAWSEKQEATRLVDTYGSGGVPLLLIAEQDGLFTPIAHGPFLGQPQAFLKALAEAR